AYGWHVVRGVDGHDADAIKAAIEEARIDADHALVHAGFHRAFGPLLPVATKPTVRCGFFFVWGSPDGR
ncbi:hypothetical protein, partial [Chimaeribacter arupi]